MTSMEPESLIQMVLRRLERVSVDSYWAHRASGVRGSLLRWLEREERGEPVDGRAMDRSMSEALEILSKAAEAKSASGGSRTKQSGISSQPSAPATSERDQGPPSLARRAKSA